MIITFITSIMLITRKLDYMAPSYIEAMSESGRRERILIACVTFETALVVHPAAHYEATKVHIIHYVKNREDDKYSIYQDFYEEVCEQICRARPVEIAEHCEKVYDFSTMLRTMLSILDSEKKANGPNADIYVNLSSGTAEYISAATVASMMFEGVTPFTVGTREFTVSPESLKSLYYEDGRPVGLSKEVYSPRRIHVHRTEMPAENSVRCLRVLDLMIESKCALSSSKIVERLKSEGLWTYEPKSGGRKTDGRQKEVMYYQRHFVDDWIGRGWIEKGQGRGKYLLTEEGRTVLDIFYRD